MKPGITSAPTRRDLGAVGGQVHPTAAIRWSPMATSARKLASAVTTVPPASTMFSCAETQLAPTRAARSRVSRAASRAPTPAERVSQHKPRRPGPAVRRAARAARGAVRRNLPATSALGSSTGRVHEPESRATLAGHAGLRAVLSGYDNRLRPTLLPYATACAPTRRRSDLSIRASLGSRKDRRRRRRTAGGDQTVRSWPPAGGRVEQREEDRRQDRDADRVGQLLEGVQRARRRADPWSRPPRG
jgi:hypothetical protein